MCLQGYGSFYRSLFPKWGGTFILIRQNARWTAITTEGFIFHLLISQHSTVSNENQHLSNTLRPRQNGRHFADDTFNRIFVNENVRISMKFSLKFVPKGPVKNIPALVQKMTWRRLGDKPLSEPVMVSSPTHICVIRPQWVKLCILSYLLAWY